eukprot:TRINITY_DN14050_c0_g1_i2.p1 TRINITY_DN14050_c0_g1~~TRINITY_DN14050_c0_g1_i2.p1  ORF type:complete len:207 (+),score=14.03 TRINITY_DN14050_c0_g1_i2:107-727(+)
MRRRPPRSTHCISSAASDVYKRQALPCRGKEDPEAFSLPLGRYDRQFEDILPGPEDLHAVDEGLGQGGDPHTEDRGGEQDDVSLDDLVVIDVHPVPLDALVQLLAGITAPADIDICLGEGNLLDFNIRIFAQGCEHPVQQRLRVPVPAGAAGKCEDLDCHHTVVVTSGKKRCGQCRRTRALGFLPQKPGQHNHAIIACTCVNHLYM